MKHAPVHVVDTSIVPRERLGDFLSLVHGQIVPIMTEAGATPLSVLASSPEIGEDVRVQITWQVADHSAWNITRKNFFSDPRWHRAAAALATLRSSGNRRFLYPA